MDIKVYNKIRHLEHPFYCAVYGNYIRAQRREDQTLVIQALKELGLPYQDNVACGHCHYVNYRRLGEEYFKFKKEIANGTGKAKKGKEKLSSQE